MTATYLSIGGAPRNPSASPPPSLTKRIGEGMGVGGLRPETQRLRLHRPPPPRRGTGRRRAENAGMQVELLSGDAEAPVRDLADRLGIPHWQAGVLPAEKAARVAQLSAEGRKVLMVGDGLNDTAALAAAHVSISPASALDAARVASDIVLLGQDMAPIADAVRISRQATRRMIENFLISGGYNVVAVPLALVGLATPLAAALAMSLSSITVSLNAAEMRRQVDGDPRDPHSRCRCFLGGIGLAAFFWAMRTKQFDDPEGDANRILLKDWDDKAQALNPSLLTPP